MSDFALEIQRVPVCEAAFSPCMSYRYTIKRVWGPGTRLIMFLMLNPSTATATDNDRTVAKCEKWSKRWGYDGLAVGNLFAYRATQPKDMMAQSDPIGPDNDKHIFDLADACDAIVCAWGNDGAYRGRSAEVVARLRARGHKLLALNLNGNGEPTHPRYLKNSTTPFPYLIDNSESAV